MSDCNLARATGHPTTTAWMAPGRTAVQSFHNYVLTRKYDFGRGSAAVWSFIAFARGDAGFPDARSWRELRAYLVAVGVDPQSIEAARTAWRSFKALRSRSRRGWIS